MTSHREPITIAQRPFLATTSQDGDDTRQRAGILLFMGLLFVYLLTGEYGNLYGADPFTNAVQARAFADDQHPVLEELTGLERPQHQGVVAWLVESPGGTTSQYPPGTALWATPFYLIDTSQTPLLLTSVEASGNTVTEQLSVPATFAPATVAAALSVALAMAFFYLTLANELPARAALGSTLLAGLGTGAWSVAADKLWQHGPAMMCISIGTYFASRGRYAASGLAFGAGVLVRPHTAVIAACIGLAVACSTRSVRALVNMGLTSVLGLIALFIYNDAVFGSPSVSGGYGGGFGDQFVGSSPWLLVARLVGSLVDARVGILWTSPFLGLAGIAAVRHIRTIPPWAIGAMLGGVVYLIVQLRANRLTGGTGFFSYRYPLEALMAAGPALAISVWHWTTNPMRVRLLAVLGTLSVIAHGVGSLMPTNL